MKTIAVIIIAWAIISAPSWIKNRRRDKQVQRIRAEQRQQHLEAVRIREAYRYQRDLAKEQNRKIDAIVKEQKKQAEILEKHEEQIRKLEFCMQQAEKDIDHNKQTLEDLNALLDLWTEQALNARNGGNTKREEQATRKIITLRNQINTAEKRIAKAEHDKAEAKRKIEAA